MAGRVATSETLCRVLCAVISEGLAITFVNPTINP
jgi:hypothetical protein